MSVSLFNKLNIVDIVSVYISVCFRTYHYCDVDSC